MQIASVMGETRETAGRHANERLRRRGMIPGVIYGHGEKPETISLSQHDLELALEKMQHVVSLKLGGKETAFLLKEVQYDHLNRTPLHVDLMRVDENERVRVDVAIELRGTPVGVADGGEMVIVINELHVECPLLEIPDHIRVKVDHLKIGDSVHVKELELPPNVKATHGPEDVVVLVRTKKTAAEAAAPVEGATVAEPEVIGRQAKEEEGEAEK